jgi:hypothetical protein
MTGLVAATLVHRHNAIGYHANRNSISRLTQRDHAEESNGRKSSEVSCDDKSEIVQIEVDARRGNHTEQRMRRRISMMGSDGGEDGIRTHDTLPGILP